MCIIHIVNQMVIIIVKQSMDIVRTYVYQLHKLIHIHHLYLVLVQRVCKCYQMGLPACKVVSIISLLLNCTECCYAVVVLSLKNLLCSNIVILVFDVNISVVYMLYILLCTIVLKFKPVLFFIFI